MKRLIFISILGLLVAFIGTLITGAAPMSPFAKHSVVNPEQKQVDAWLSGKPRSPIRVHLRSPRGMAHDSKETTQIQALVQVTRPMENSVLFTWHLPDGAQVVQGDLTGNIPNLRPGEIYRIAITVTGIGIKELPRNVSLTVSTDIRGQQIAATGIFASHEMQADGSFRARRERGPTSSSWFSKTSAADDDSQIPVSQPPKGIHF